MIIGIFFAVLNGLVTPMFAWFFGELTDAFNP